MKSAAAIAALLALAACSPPPPRDIAYFEAHPNDADAVVRDCERGGRSNECANARAANSRLTSKSRLERYRKGFE